MKVKVMIGGLMALMVGFASAYAQTGYYCPPERLNCRLISANKFTCNQINRQYLAEDVTTAALRLDVEETFHFVSAVAYYSKPQEGTNAGPQGLVFFTYHNSNLKMVTLKTIDPFVHPDLNNGDWKKVQGDIYTCETGYMRCPVTRS